MGRCFEVDEFAITKSCDVAAEIGDGCGEVFALPHVDPLSSYEYVAVRVVFSRWSSRFENSLPSACWLVEPDGFGVVFEAEFDNWIDRNCPNQPPRRIHTSQTPQLKPQSIAVLSYRDYFNQYRQHPESKALDPLDGKRCHPWTRGELQPWHITATEHTRVGKESNRLTDTRRPSDDEEEQVIEYAPGVRHDCQRPAAVVFRRMQEADTSQAGPPAGAWLRAR